MVMNRQRPRLVSKRYPEVPNHIVNDPTPKSEAVLVPSVTPEFAMDVFAQNWTRALPAGIQPPDLNFLDPGNRLFRISHVMSSAGQALRQPRDCIITQRNRASTILIGDSGGYQVAGGSLRIKGSKTVIEILRWLERHSDIAMTLDVPTGPILRKVKTYPYKTSRDCLQATLEYLALFQKRRVPGKIRLLNVLQGNTVPESDAWYDAVKHFEFEGWAFAGILRHNIYNLCRRILQMADEGLIQDKAWIHVLGTGELDTAVLLTALQRAINRTLNRRLRISFDVSSPFRNLKWGNVYTLPDFDRKRMTMPTSRVMDGPEFVDSDVQWPWPSPLGDHMRIGDFCVERPVTANRMRDKQSDWYLAHHNLSVLCYGIALANRVFDSESINHKHTKAEPVGAAVEAIDRVFETLSPDTLRKYERTFRRLRHGADPTLPDTGDDDRDP
jgi:hypothetical protein